MDKPELRLPAPLALTGTRRAARAPRDGIARQLRASTALRQMLRATAWSGVSIAIMSSASANPTGGTVVSGQANINQVNPNRTEITQTTDRAAINWQSFSVGANQYTVFFQPSSSSVALNRVLGSDPSLIAGHLQANGNLILINPNGVLFSRGSQVDVHGIVATTADIRDRDFNDGRFNFSIPSPNANATVVNEGTITVADHGLAALVAPGTANSGTITAKFGRIMLAGAQTFTVDLYGDGLLSFDVTSKVKGATVGNTGKLEADGGIIQLSASGVDDIVTGVINMGGTVAANTIGTQTGSITADAGASGQLSVTGQVSAQGANAGESGGAIALTGGSVAVAAGASLDASGSAGGGSIKLGGGFHGTDTSIASAQITTVAAGATLDASAVQQGNGGAVVVWSDKKTSFAGAIRATGGAKGGDGGNAEVSSKGVLAFTGRVDLSAPQGQRGTLLLDPTEIDVVATPVGANDMAASTIETELTTTNVDLVADTVHFETNVAYTGPTDASLAAHATTAILFDPGVSISSSTAKLSVNLDAGVAGAVTLGAHSSIATNGGNLSIAAGTGGLTLDSTASLATGGASGDGNLSLTAPSMTLGGTLNSGSGATTITAAGNGLSVGTGTVATTLGISDGTLDKITAGGGLTLATRTGQDITVDGTVTNHAGFTSLTLQSGGNIDLKSDVAYTGTSAETLTAAATGAITVEANHSITSANAPLRVALTAGTAGAVTLKAHAAIATHGAGLSIAAGSGGIALDNTASLSTTGATNGDLSLSAPSLSLSGTIDAGTATLTLIATDATATGTIAESNATITAGVLKGSSGGTTNLSGAGSINAIGDIKAFAVAHNDFSFTGSVALGIDGALGAPGTVTLNAPSITEAASGTITAATLTGATTGTVLLAQAGNAVATLGDFSTGTGSFTLTDGAALTVAGNVATGGGNISLTAPGPELKITGTLNSGAGTTTITGPTGIALVAGALDSAAPGGSLLVADGSLAQITAGGGLVLTATGADLFANGVASHTGFNQLTLNGNNIAIDGALAVGTTAGTLNLAAAGSITENTGAITVATLTGTAGGSATLNGTNAVTNLGPFTATTGNLAVTDGQTLNIAGGLTAGGGVVLSTVTAGDLTLHADIHAGTTVALTAVGAIDQIAGVITAPTLTASSGGNTALNDANAIGALGSFSSTAGSLSLIDTGTLTVNGPVSAHGAVSLTSDSLLLAGNLTAGTSVALNATGSISQTGGAITAASLTGGAGTSASLGGTNAIADLGTFTAGSDFTLNNGGAALTIDGTVTAPGTLTLNAGSITEIGAGGKINAGTLAGSTQAGVVDLSQPGNTITTLGAFSTSIPVFGLSVGNSFTLVDAIALTVTGPVRTAALLGSTDISLTAPSLSLAGSLDAGTGHLSLRATGASGAIAESNTATLNAASMSGSTNHGNVSLDQGSNSIGTLAGFTTGGGNFSLTDGTALNVSALLSTSGGGLSLTVPGLTLGVLPTSLDSGGGTTTITALGEQMSVGNGFLSGAPPGSLVLNNATLDAINAGGGLILATQSAQNILAGGVATHAGFNKVTLNSGGSIDIDPLGNVTVNTLALNAAGTITEHTFDVFGLHFAGSITANTLTGTSTGGANLAGGNQIAQLGPFTNTGPGSFALNDVQPLTISGPANAGVGNLTLNVTGNLGIGANLSAGGTVALNATGTINQTAGIITANSLAGSSNGGASFNGTNQIANLGTFANSNAGNFSLTNGEALSVTGTVNAGSGNLTLDVAGNLAIGASIGAGSTVTVSANGAISQTGGVISGVNVALGAGGPISQTGGGSITATTLTGSSTGGAALGDLNHIVNLGTFANSGTGGFSLTDAQALNVTGPVNAGSENLALHVAAGNLAVGANLTAGKTATLDVTGAITQTAGTIKGNTVALDATGSIDQLGGTIIATTLTGFSTGGTSLGESNQVTNLGPFANSGAGGFGLAATTDLTVTGPVNAGSGDLALLAGGNLFLGANLTTPGTMTLFANAIDQTNGVLTAGKLTGSSHAGTSLLQDNEIATLGPFDTNIPLGSVSGVISTLVSLGSTPVPVSTPTTSPVPDGFRLNDARSLTVTGGVDAGTSGITLQVKGDLTLANDLHATDTVQLSATGAINQTGGAITAATLTGSAGGDALFFGNNTIGTLGAFSAAGSFFLGDLAALTVTGPVTAGNGGSSILEILDANGITLAGNLSAGGIVALGAEGGPLSQTSGAITTNIFEAISVGGATLAQPNNQIASVTFFENVGGGDVLIKDMGPLMVGGTLLNPGGRFAIQSTGALTLGAANFDAGGGVELGAASIMQTGNVTVSPQTPLVVIDTTGAALPQMVNPASGPTLLSSFAPGGASGDITLTQFSAPNSSVLLAANHGRISASAISARNLAILGDGGSAQLFGSVGNVSGSTAAQIVDKSGRPENQYRFNGCAIRSVTCTVLPAIVPTTPAVLSNVSILSQQQQFNDPTINLLNVGSEDLF